MRLLGQRPRYQEGPPEGAGHVGWPPSGARSSEEPARTKESSPTSALTGSFRASAARTEGDRVRSNNLIRTHGLALGTRAQSREGLGGRHAGSLEALRVARPEA